MAIKLIDIANEIVDELDNPSDITDGLVHFWLVQNVGALNNHINGTYVLNDALNDTTTALGEGEKAILKQMFYVHYYDKKIRSSLGAASVSPVVEVSENGASVRLIRKTEIAMHYKDAKKVALEELKNLINGYKEGKTTPLQVRGKDTIEGRYYEEVFDINPRAITT